MAVERFLSDELMQAFPDDGFQGEEGGISRGGSLRWVADPIDGTSNFRPGRRQPLLCVAGLSGGRYAFDRRDRSPAMRETISARAGHGARLNDQRSVPPTQKW